MRQQGTAYREAIGELTARVDSTLERLDASALSGHDLLDAVTRVEAFGRRADALRLRLAAEVASRAGGPVDAVAAAGYASAVNAVAHRSGASEVDAARRIRLGQSLAPGFSISGAATSPRYPAVSAAVASGDLGVDAAEVLVRGLDGAASRVDPVRLHKAETSLVDLARGSEDRPPLQVELVRVQLATFLLAIDPDGARPREQRARQSRRFSFGTETPDGLIPVHGLLAPEVGVAFRRLVDAHKRRPSFTQAAADADADTVPASADDRTPAQRRHDTLADILSAASRVKDAPELAGSAPAVTVTVTLADLDARRGAGSLEGHLTPLSIDAVERLIDSRGMQAVTMSEQGRILALGSTQRCFTASQRRAITARDGGCIIPGCTTPAGWCEVHHVIPWRDDGPTHTDNGVLLCWGHHQIIDSGPWRLSMPDGVPHVRGPGHPEWTPVGGSRVRSALPRTG